MEKIKLEAGKYYRTRDGRKTFVAGFSPFEDQPYAAVGFFEGAGSASWDVDGTYIKGNIHDKDLVAEWKEPKRIKGRMYIVDNGIGVVGGYLQELPWAPLKVPAGARVLACIEIDVLEGEGLER